MQSDASQSGGSIALLTWLEVNKQKLLIGGGAAVVVFFGAFLFIQHQAQKETAASQALSDVRLPFSAAAATPPDTADKLASVAAEYSGSKAAARALLISAGILFADAKSAADFAKAEQRFTQVTKEYPESPWIAQATLGVAASLAAQGKTAEATAKYEDVRRRFATSPVIDDAKLALARIYEKDKPEDAFKLYEELIKEGGNNVMGMEANIRQSSLLKARPELAKLREPVLPPPSATPPIQITPAVSNAVKGVVTNVQAMALTNRPGSNPPVQIKLNPTPTPGAANPAPAK